MIKIAVLGYGTVGSGVLEVFRKNGILLHERIGEEIQVAYVLDRKEFPDDPVEALLVHDYETIIQDEEIQIVAEVMGGLEPAYTFVKRALKAGKSVVTSNKELVATYGTKLLELAKKHHANFLFEASVGGGIPIIRALNHSLTGDDIEEVMGILNGTTNYILSKMFYEGADYAHVLKEAQDHGYAERNPEADVEGWDACRKIAILASLISGKFVNFEEIYTEGITDVTAEDMKYAKEMNSTIKLLAIARKDAGGMQTIVAPFLLKQTHPLATVNDVFNAVFVRGNMLGDAMFYGSGAGKLPTASAVVADIVDAAKHRHIDVTRGWQEEKLELEHTKEIQRKFFIRFRGLQSEYEAKIGEAFGTVTFVHVEELKEEFGIVTEVMSEDAYEKVSKHFPNIIHMIRLGE